MVTESPHFLAVVATLVVVALLILLVTQRRDAATARRTAARMATPAPGPHPADGDTAATGAVTTAPPPAAAAPEESEAVQIDRMVFNYIAVVDRHVGQLAVDAIELPAPKADLRRALQILMRNAVDEVARARLANYYVRLAAFQPGPIALPDMTDAPVDWTSLPVNELRELLITVRNDAVSDLLIRIELEEKRMQKDVQAITALAAEERVLQPD